jgi:hypothetical protein
VSRGTLDTAMLTRLSCTGLSPSLAGFPKTFPLDSLVNFAVRTPTCTQVGLGSSAFARRYSQNHMLFSLPPATYRVPFLTLCIGVRILEVCSSRFPHSEISGSKDICSSPKLFAAYHVFHRLLVPRHPPYALSSITNCFHPREWMSATHT